jgi:hypothetical protein
MKKGGGQNMRHSNLKLGHGTNGNPQQTISQSETKIKSKELETQLLINNRDKLLKSVKTQKAKNIISELYRPGASIGDGGTADMLIDEANNGIQPGKKSHYQKAIDRVREISRTLSKNLAPGDEEVLIKEKNKLEKAIELWEKKNGKK